MRILMLCDSLSLGGAETHILTLVRGLTREGAKITLISAGGVYEKAIREFGVKCIRAPLDRRDPISIFRSFRIIRRFIRQCETVHAHTRLTAFLAKRARRGNFPKIVVTAHLDFKRRGVGRLSYFGDYTLSVSEDIKEHLVNEYRINGENIDVTRNGIDLEVFRRQSEGDELVISHVSRLDPDRADVAFLLVELAPKLSRDYPNIKIRIVGTGERYEELLEKARLANYESGREVIVLLGGRSDVENVVARSTLFVGVSRAALEAMALGVACIIAGNDGYGGVICKDNLTNLIKTNLCARGFEKANAKKLYSDIVSLISNKSERDKLCDMQYELIRETYSSETMCADATRAYERVLSKPRVSILGYYGFGNIGDELTLRYCIDALRERGVLDISVFTKRPLQIAASVNQVSRANPVKIIRALSRSDVLILGGGNLLQNESSTRSLFYYATVITLARLMGLRIYFISSGIGELRGTLARLVSKIALRRADFIGARTKADKERFDELCKCSARLMPDLCFLHRQAVHTVDGFTPPSERYILLIASRLEKNTVRCAEELKAKLECELYVCTMFDEKDGVKVSLECADNNHSYIRIKNCNELFSLIGGAVFVISERLHGAIISLGQKKFSLLSASTEKNRALIDEMAKRCGKGNCIILPIESYADIKEVGAECSDFDKVLSRACDDINSSLDEIF